MNTGKVHEFVLLTREKRQLEAQLNSVKQSLEELEAELLDQMMDSGIQNMKTPFGTIYLHSQVWASYPKNDDGEPQYQDANEALKEAGLGTFVNERFNSNTLSAWVRELPRDDMENPILPEQLKGKLDVATKWGVRARLSS